MSKLPRLIITPGEPAGVGPDVCIKLLQKKIDARLLLVADPQMLRQRAAQLKLPADVVICEAGQEPPAHRKQLIAVAPVSCPQAVTAGKLNKNNAPYVIQTLEHAADMLANDQADALVTAPVHKGIINDAGIQFSGHTEWLAQRTNTPLPVMMLATPQLKVALVTTHLPLKQVSKAITAERLEAVIRVLRHDLQYKFRIRAPRIRVCGLNPHAGENGHIGDEEIKIMRPVMQRLQNEGFDLDGPAPADTAFLPRSLARTDAILAMYHDQGLPVIKHSDFERAVNVTLGLPIIRTSVDHGVALALAGAGGADAGSLMAAITMAANMASPHGNTPTA